MSIPYVQNYANLHKQHKSKPCYRGTDERGCLIKKKKNQKTIQLISNTRSQIMFISYDSND